MTEEKKPYGSDWKVIWLDRGLKYIPKSQYVIGKIKELNFSNPKHRDYVRSISRLEELVLRGAHSWAGGMMYASLKSQHPDEYKAIYSELKPTEWDRKEGERLAEEERRKKQKAIDDKAVAEELRQYEAWWLSVGGKK